MDEIIKEIKNISDWVNKNKSISTFKDNNEYMKFAVEFGNHIRYLLAIGAGMTSEHKDGYSKKEAVIVGLFVRMYKLYDALCYHIAERQGEISQIFVRLIFETSINIKYLIKKNESSIENFIFISYKSTKEIHQDLSRKKEERKLIPIEERILSKIEFQLKDDNINIEELIKNKAWKLDGKNFRRILDDLDIESGYPYIFGSGSSYVHGDWKDIRAHHIIDKEQKFYPYLDHTDPDPRYIGSISLICLGTLISFIRWNNSDSDNFIMNIANELVELIQKFELQHEEYFGKLEDN